MAVVIGTDQDPQGLEQQIEALERAGVRVFLTVSALVRGALSHLAERSPLEDPLFQKPSPLEISRSQATDRLHPPAPPAPPEPPGTPVPLAAVEGPLAAVNVGLESFYDSLRTQGAPAVQVDWRPPAGGDEKLAGILARLKGR
jgi:FdrA protein